MKQKIPTFKADRAAAAFVDKADLTHYDLSGAQLTRFEIKPKDKSISLRLSEELYTAVRKRAARAGVPYQALHSRDPRTSCRQPEIDLYVKLSFPGTRVSAGFFPQRVVQQKLDVRLVPDSIAVRQLPGGRDVLARQPDGYRKQLPLSAGLTHYVPQRHGLDPAHGGAQVRLDSGAVLLPPDGFLAVVPECRNDQFFSRHDSMFSFRTVLSLTSTGRLPSP